MGGHNGLRSMKAGFGSADFWRLRIGIGRPDSRLPGKGGNPETSLAANIADWVLTDFSPLETEALAPVLVTGAELLVKALEVEPQSLLPEWAKKGV
jgi:peptidyl-tRNA hydrolase, PTH1 family